MTKREIRENVFKVLFRVEFYDKDEEGWISTDMAEQLSIFRNELEEAYDPQATAEELNYINNKSTAIIMKLPELDRQINEKTTGWKTTRMSKVDLTILRLAVYEILFEPAIPVKVSINEAVELAKQYGTTDSSSFVNGVLAKFA